MRTALALLTASIVVSCFASGASGLLWAVLTWLFVVLFMAALFRVFAVVNAPRRKR